MLRAFLPIVTVGSSILKVCEPFSMVIKCRLSNSIRIVIYKKFNCFCLFNETLAMNLSIISDDESVICFFLFCCSVLSFQIEIYAKRSGEKNLLTIPSDIIRGTSTDERKNLTFLALENSAEKLINGKIKTLKPTGRHVYRVAQTFNCMTMS